MSFQFRNVSSNIMQFEVFYLVYLESIILQKGNVSYLHILLYLICLCVLSCLQSSFLFIYLTVPKTELSTVQDQLCSWSADPVFSKKYRKFPRSSFPHSSFVTWTKWFCCFDCLCFKVAVFHFILVLNIIFSLSCQEKVFLILLIPYILQVKYSFFSLLHPQLPSCIDKIYSFISNLLVVFSLSMSSPSRFVIPLTLASDPYF